jgi:hypothetical protein
MQKSAPDELIYKTRIQAAEAPLPAADAELPEFWTEVVGQAISEYVAPFRQEFATKLGEQQREISELRGQVTALLTLLQGKAADVVNLPRKHA